MVVFNFEWNGHYHFYRQGFLVLILMELSHLFQSCVSKSFYLERSSNSFLYGNFIDFVVHHKDNMYNVKSKQHKSLVNLDIVRAKKHSNYYQVQNDEDSVSSNDPPIDSCPWLSK
jgi:hypothetical protein